MNLLNFFLILLFIYPISAIADTNNSVLATIEVEENANIPRDLEYITLQIQIPFKEINDQPLNIMAVESGTEKNTPCQVLSKLEYKDQNIVLAEIIFPLKINAGQTKTYQLVLKEKIVTPKTDLLVTGNGPEMVVENLYYKADLTKSDESIGKSHSSGQLRELLIKEDDVLLRRAGNRMHWAPNFQKKGFDSYSTIAGWNPPESFKVSEGPYCVFTQRSGDAPGHPGIFLTANYWFYAGLPWFKFYASMEIKKNIWLFLLRNDEMTMDGLFTNVAFCNDAGKIIDLKFEERYDVLEKNHISDDAPWLCFYNADKGYAFGSIRLDYDNSNSQGLESPLYQPYTKISDGAGGGKYWNRRLINERDTFVTAGSRYVEENVYLVFKIEQDDPFKQIKQWSEILNHTLQVKVSYP